MVSLHMVSTTLSLPRSARALRSQAAASSSSPRCCIVRCSGSQQQQAAAGRRQQQRQQHVPASLAQLAAGLSAAGIALPAAADEAMGEAYMAAQDMAANDPTTLVMGALFTTAIAALTVVTLGVAYLSYSSWNDSRIEQEDRRRVENFRSSAASNGAGPSAAKKKKEKPAKAPEEFKGFGKQ